MSSESKKSIIKDSSLYLGSNYFAQVLGLVISIATKRFMGPTMVGVWSLLKVILGYSAYATLGTSKAAFREIPYHRGRNDVASAERVKNEVFTFTLIMSLLPALGIGLYALFMKATLSSYMYYGLLYVAFIVILQRLYDYYTTLLRANKQFLCIGEVTVIGAVLNLIFVFLLIKPFNLYGLFAASFLSTVIGYLYVYIKTRYAFKLQLSKSGLAKLLQIGIPLLITGLCAQTIRSIDKILIAKYMGLTALGAYSIALMVFQYVIGVPNMLAIVLYPRMQEKFGQIGSAEGMKHYLVDPIRIVLMFIVILVFCSISVVPVLTYKVLPEFTSGIKAMMILVCSTYFYAIGQQASTFLVTLDKQWRMIPILIMGMGGMLIACLSFIHWKGGIVSVSCGVVLGAAFYNIILVAYAQKQFLSLKTIGKNTLYFMLQFTYMTLGAFIISKIGRHDELLSAFLRLLVSGILAFPVIYWVNRKTGILATAWSMIKTKRASA